MSINSNEETINNAGTKSAKICAAIDALRSESTSENLRAVIDELKDAALFMPSVFEFSERDRERAEHHTSSNKFRASDPFKVRPAIMRDDSGNNYIPVYTDRTQIPDKDRRRFTYVTIGFSQCCTMAKNNIHAHSIVVNPFTSRFIVPDETVNTVGQSPVGSEGLRKGSADSFFPINGDAQPVADKAAEFFRGRPSVKRAAACIAKKGKVSSILIAADIEGDDPRTLFKELFDMVRDLAPGGMRVHFTILSSIQKRLEESGIVPFYTTD